MKTIAGNDRHDLPAGSGNMDDGSDSSGAQRVQRAGFLQRFETLMAPGLIAPNTGSVWVPDVAPGFQPYGNFRDTGLIPCTAGHGSLTIDWGWAPFHYGGWYFDNWYGWVRVPGVRR
ncbi:MAG: hypothetical protein MZV63_55780 [Marinilabiliales bacterium]|nr:hypothetical protein [Marinilabiliales bacterium]